MRRAVLATICGLGLMAPAGSVAAGGPVPSVQGGVGVSATGSPFNFVALGAGNSTVVERVRRDGGMVDAYSLIRGSFGVPSVAYDGSNTGLAADGRTLVLAGIPTEYFPRRTQLLVLDTKWLRTDARITLPGYFVVDAISPTGRWLYLIHYRSPSNATAYEVRAYDLATRQLLAKPVVDPRNPGEKMQGVSVTRTMSSDGRWAYTLYQRVSGAPFIHALDTATRSAFCVDLPALAGADLSGVQLALAPATTLRIERNKTLLAVMNTRTLAVRRPHAAQSQAESRRAAPGRHDGGPSWTLGIAPLAALIGLVLLAQRRRRSLIAQAGIADAH
jgi:hypothetical protein